MYDTTVTVFNLYRSKQLGVSTWYPHVISGCYFNADKAANIEKTGLKNADTARLHIPYKEKEGKIFLKGSEGAEVQYLLPKEWDNQTNDMYEKTVTFTEGEDFFFIGEYPEKPINDDVFASGTTTGFKDYMNKNFDNVFSVTSVGKYQLIPHFELGGA